MKLNLYVGIFSFVVSGMVLTRLVDSFSVGGLFALLGNVSLGVINIAIHNNEIVDSNE